MNINDQFGKRFAVGKLFRIALATVVLSVLSACGGGGGSAGSSGSTGGTGGTGGTGTTNAGLVNLVLLNGTTESNLLSASSPLTAQATVTNASGASVGKDVLVTFTLDNGLAILSPATALTSANGVATISLQSGAGVGAGTLTATASLNGTDSIKGQKTFKVSPSASATPIAIDFLTAVPSDASIVKKGSGGNGRSEVAILTFAVRDSSGGAIPNVKVNFSLITNPGSGVTLGVLSGNTDAAGKVTTTVSSGAIATSVTVFAIVAATPNVNVISNTVTVTTGVATLEAMTLAVEKFWVEGLNVSDQKVAVSAYLADSQGQAVADNTQVVFTTDVGAVLGINGAQCQTNQANITGATPRPGFCSIYWRSQNPTKDGRATIIASSTNNSVSITQNAYIYVLGSYAKIYKVAASAAEGRLVSVSDPDHDKTTAAPLIELDFTAACTTQTLDFEIVDSNNNAMPPASTIVASAAPNSVTFGAIYPLTVPHYSVEPSSPDFLLVHRGTVHHIDVTPPAACNSASSNTPIYSSFDIKVVAPSKAEQTATIA
ncbi:MAG: hypothetical protein NTY70_18910, partial [Burkholderiales bacterium]|nr:hypothetical protein [Burkholderiales bacterium]